MSDDLKSMLEYALRDNAERVSWQPVGSTVPIVLTGGISVGAKLVHYEDTDDDYSGNVWFVIEVGERYFKRYGTYRSHYGYEWDYGRFEEVFPKTVTKVVYES